jgi:O-antigen/teichoic acid export membrane protein
MIYKLKKQLISKINSSERYKKVFLTGVSTGLVKVFTGLINLFTVPLTLDYLGNERYGLWMSISSMIALMSFADLGLGNGLLNEISKAKANDLINYAKTAVSSTFFMLLAVSMSLSIILFFVYPYVEWYSIFNVKSKIAISETETTFLVLFLIFIINIPIGIVQRIQEGYQEGYIYQIWIILGSFISLIALLIAIYFQAGLAYLVLAFSSGQIIATLLNGIQLFIFKKPELLPNIKNFSFIEAKKLFKNGTIFLALGIFALIANTSDNLIIANVIGLEHVAGYEIVKKLFFFSMITAFFITPLWPAFSEAFAKGDFIWIKRTRNLALKISLVSGVVITTPLLLFGKEIIGYWIDANYTPSWSLLFGFFIYIIINNYIGVMSTLLNSGNYAKKQIIPLLITCILSIFFKIILANKFGVSGVIWGTILSWTIGFAIPSFIISNKIIKELEKK